MLIARSLSARRHRSFLYIHFKDAKIFCVFNCKTNKRFRGKTCVAAQAATSTNLVHTHSAYTRAYNEYSNGISLIFHGRDEEFEISINFSRFNLKWRNVHYSHIETMEYVKGAWKKTYRGGRAELNDLNLIYLKGFCKKKVIIDFGWKGLTDAILQILCDIRQKKKSVGITIVSISNIHKKNHFYKTKLPHMCSCKINKLHWNICHYLSYCYVSVQYVHCLERVWKTTFSPAKKNLCENETNTRKTTNSFAAHLFFYFNNAMSSSVARLFLTISGLNRWNIPYYYTLINLATL